MIKSIGITIVIDDIKKEEDIRLIDAVFLKSVPPETVHLSTEKYSKFPDAYKLEYSLPVSAKINSETRTYQMLQLADGMAKPWLVYFDGEGYNTELIFNRDEHTQFARPEFSCVRWAHLQLIY